MKSVFTLSTGIALLGFAASSAMAQTTTSSWAGGYFGAHFGQASKPEDSRSDRFLFDTDLDGEFDNTVFTTTGANAFSPGSCSGVPVGPRPSDLCGHNSHGTDVGMRLGYDWQSGNLVYGLVVDYSMNDAEDAVTSFSTTPAFYSMSREVDDALSIRARIGHAFGANNQNLIYVVGGVVRANIENTYTTSNGVNTFTNSGDSEADGSQWGAGYEFRVRPYMTIGIEYLWTTLKDDEFRVRAAGPAPATNPFILNNAAGTDFRRSDRDLVQDSVRITAAYRF